ncbi:MFS transporter [Aeromicrobium chenweiae]|uniref:MFS transporter n=1 Tax=Aeromicrobium chenweiae TaxID=2079793 RepID=A0A2S0WMC6_9ACTN|nr:MFS transporter [Aeromicrobium chenweiae]AWB92420.1 MFS transporter [Aeromicrobium chenweiae]TGN31292.1 MFS transporter [Aeromicrobium chenweiae]
MSTQTPRVMAGLHWSSSGERSASPARHHAGFWFIALAFVSAMAFSTVPAPLYSLYQARDGFSTFMITVIFAVYALGVMISLVLAGHISDWVGRKTILVPALGLELVAAVLFLTTPNLAILLGARFVSGLGIGMLTATATAHLHDLHRGHRADASDRRFEVVSTAANIGGLGLGALVSGVLAEHVSSPLRTPYIVFVVLLALSIVAVMFTPETVEERTVRPVYRPQLPTSTHGARAQYLAAVAAGFASFAVFGVFTSVAPAFVGGVLHEPSRTVAGLVVFAVFGAAAVAQTVTGSLGTTTKLALGVGAQAVGLVALVVSMHQATMPLFVVAGMVTGAGAGMLFKSAVGGVAGLAAPAQRGAALAGLFLIAYVGMSVSALSFGLLTQQVSSVTAMTWLTAVILVVLAGVAALGRPRANA